MGELLLRNHLEPASPVSFVVASSSHHHFIRYFTEKLKGRERERGIKTKMRVKLAAKMLVIAWTLMKKKEMFDPGYLKD
jgi:transposase